MNGKTHGKVCNIGASLIFADFYVNDPYNAANFTHEQQQMILGGEGCVWGEQDVCATVIDN